MSFTLLFIHGEIRRFKYHYNNTSLFIDYVGTVTVCVFSVIRLKKLLSSKVLCFKGTSILVRFSFITF